MLSNALLTSLLLHYFHQVVVAEWRAGPKSRAQKLEVRLRKDLLLLINIKQENRSVQVTRWTGGGLALGRQISSEVILRHEEKKIQDKTENSAVGFSCGHYTFIKWENH